MNFIMQMHEFIVDLFKITELDRLKTGHMNIKSIFNQKIKIEKNNKKKLYS